MLTTIVRQFFENTMTAAEGPTRVMHVVVSVNPFASQQADKSAHYQKYHVYDNHRLHLVTECGYTEEAHAVARFNREIGDKCDHITEAVRGRAVYCADCDSKLREV